jgi:hypothetical protein
MRWLIGLFAFLLFITTSFAQVVERPNFIYHFDNPLYIQTADSALTEVRGRLIQTLSDSLSYRPQIYIPDNIDTFKAIVGSAFPDWGAAAALPYRRLIAVKSPAHFPLGRSLREMLQHEYAHLALEHRLRHVPPPRWLDEGMAMLFSFEWGWNENLSMTRAVLFGGLVPLNEIENLNRFSQSRAATGYAESYLAVKYLLDNYGTESFNIFLDNLAASKAVDSALMAATGSGYEGFQKEFFDYLAKRYTIMTFFSDTIYLWLALALVVVIGFFLRYRRKKQYYKKWDEEDRYQSRDFDYGDPDNPEQIDDDDKPWA